MIRGIGHCFGLGLPLEASAEHLGIAPNTLRKYLSEHGTEIQTIRAEVEAVAAKKFAKTIQRVEKKAENALSLVETKNAIRKELYDKILDRLKREEVLDDDILAKLARIGLEFTDEKPAQVQKRISETTVTHEISDETWERIERHIARPPIKATIVSALPAGPE